MKQRIKTIMVFFTGFALAMLLTVGTGAQKSGVPKGVGLNTAVDAQVSNARPNWISNQRQAANDLIAAAQKIVALDQEYVGNGYGSALVSGDFSGANAGLTVADMTTAEGNLLNIAQGVLGIGSFPKSIVTGTNSTIFKIR